MAKKRDFKAEYARRIARNLAKGKTRQQARGHKVHEHIERKEHEREREGLTHAEQRIVFRWAEKRNYEVHDNEVDSADVVDVAKIQGYEWFKEYRRFWEHTRRRYLKEAKNESGKIIGSIGALMNYADQLDMPDVGWLYYH